MKKKIPWLLIYFRLALTVPAVLLGYFHITGGVYVVLMAAAALSDVYDGVLARKYGVETAWLRQWDSAADTIFFAGVVVGMFLAFPDLVRPYFWGIVAIPALEVIRYCFDFLKFGRGAAYHAISAKVFGALALTACISIMGFSCSEPFLKFAVIAGLISEVEGLAMSIMLKKWTYNVKHIGVVFRSLN